MKHQRDIQCPVKNVLEQIDAHLKRYNTYSTPNRTRPSASDC